MIKLSVRKDMKSVSGKGAYLKEFKSLVYCMLLLFYAVTDLAQYKLIKTVVGCSILLRYDCTVAKSAIYIVIYTMELCVYI